MSKLANLIATGVAAATKRKNWHDKLPPDARREVDEVKKRFLAGAFGDATATVVARILRHHCKERGWRVSDLQRLAEWLKEKA